MQHAQLFPQFAESTGVILPIVVPLVVALLVAGALIRWAVQ